MINETDIAGAIMVLYFIIIFAAAMFSERSNWRPKI